MKTASSLPVVGVLMGGYSGEYSVSMKSGQVVYQALQSLERFRLFRVVISRQVWEVIDENEERYPLEKNDFSFLQGEERQHFDYLFNAIHGHPGEDGPLAGYFEMLGLSFSSSPSFASALTFNKAECNMVLREMGFRTPQAYFLGPGQKLDLERLKRDIGFPCFVKPSRSGSSIGVSKVKKADELEAAVARAREIDSKVLIEKMVAGLEIACGVSDHSGKPEALAITHIVPKNEFFDYESKYSGLSEEVTPAALPAEQYESILRQSEQVYRLLELAGLARIDYIVEQDSAQAVLIEVNTVPGLSAESILPRQAHYRGLDLASLFSQSLLRQKA